MNALARLLPDFELIGSARFEDIAGMPALEPAEFDPVAAAAEAEERGYRAGYEAARAEAESRAAEEAARFEERFAEARRSWADEQAERLAEQIPTALATLETALAEATARALAPFVASAVVEKALDDLRDTIVALLADDAPAVLKIAGPEDLVRPLRDRLGAAAAPIEFVADHRGEVRVIADNTVLETQLRAWSDRLAKAVW
jgi:hypothetical protein